MGKILKSLLVSRMEAHMPKTGIVLTDRQYNFQKGRSTDNVLRVVQTRLVDACNARRVAVAVNLNIQNTFNSVDSVVIRHMVSDIPPADT